jgi:hypothetical protein
MMTPERDADFASWIARNPPPSVQSLALQHGGCANIPEAAWADFDDAMERWQEPAPVAPPQMTFGT